MKLSKFFTFNFLSAALMVLFFGTAFASTTDGTIDSTYRSALLCENDACTISSQINFKPTLGTPIHVTDTKITGNAWSENFGWINFNPTQGGVINTSNGVLSGYAWGDGAGWINFKPTMGGVTINTSGQFAGYAWSENYGWIKFDCGVANACVVTDWRPLSVRGSGGGHSGGGSSGPTGPSAPSLKDICPNINGMQTLIPSGLVISSAGNCIAPQQCNIIDGALKQPIDVMIIIDKSGSMAGTKIVQAKNAADAFISNLVLGSDKVGYVSYSDKAVLVEGLTSSFDAVNQKIQQTVVSGGTNIGGALKIAYKELKKNGRDNVKHVIILMTDGEANISDDKNFSPNQSALNNSVLAKLDGMAIYSVGLGSSVDSGLLKSIATYPGNYYYSPTGTDLSNVYLKIAAIECTAAPSKISDIVIYDKNANGLYDGGEKGLSNINISLISKDDSQPVRTIYSSSDGSFVFNNVAAGAYSVCVVVPDSMIQTLPVTTKCYSINVIQGLDVSSLRFMLSGKVPPVIPEPVVDPYVPVDIPVVPPTIPEIPVVTPVLPTIVPVEPTVPPLPSEVSKIDTETKNDSNQNSITDKVGDFFAYILGTSGDGSGMAITQNSFSEVKEKINNFTYIAGMISQKFIDKTSEIFNTEVGKVTTKIVATGGAMTGLYFGVVNVAFATPVSFAEIFLTPMRLWSLLLIAIGLKKRKVPWGTVYDSVTKQPLDPAYVVLQDLDGKEIATSITDLDGRYGFLVSSGKYRLIASKTNYEFPSKKLNGQNRDELYNELYFSEIIEVKDGEVITKNIPMDPIKFDWNEFAKKDQKLMRFYSKRELIIARLADILFAGGFVVTVISVLVSPVIYNFVIFILYVLMIVLQKTILRPRAFGHIKQKETMSPLPFAIMRVFFDGSDNEVIHKVADKTGKYYCLIPNGKYYAKIENKNQDESYSLAYTSEPIEVKNGYINKMFEV